MKALTTLHTVSKRITGLLPRKKCKKLGPKVQSVAHHALLSNHLYHTRCELLNPITSQQLRLAAKTKALNTLHTTPTCTTDLMFQNMRENRA